MVSTTFRLTPYKELLSNDYFNRWQMGKVYGLTISGPRNQVKRRVSDYVANPFVFSAPILLPWFPSPPATAPILLPRAGRPTLPTAMFKGTRGYIERVIYQLNVSYSYGLYDCCTVMCRRLFETLIIEVYEGAGRADELKGGDGNFKMFCGSPRPLGG
jgi:hypothetical protein